MFECTGAGASGDIFDFFCNILFEYSEKGTDKVIATARNKRMWFRLTTDVETIELSFPIRNAQSGEWELPSERLIDAGIENSAKFFVDFDHPKARKLKFVELDGEELASIYAKPIKPRQPSFCPEPQTLLWIDYGVILKVLYLDVKKALFIPSEGSIDIVSQGKDVLIQFRVPDDGNASRNYSLRSSVSVDFGDHYYPKEFDRMELLYLFGRIGVSLVNGCGVRYTVWKMSERGDVLV